MSAQTQGAPPRGALPAVLLLAYAVIWLALAINPVDRQDWALENLLVAIALPLLWRSWRGGMFSNASCVCFFLFFTLHALGAHYTYSLVPYDDWWAALAGHSLNAALGWQRNHFDRLVHLAYGLLMSLPSIELLQRRAPPQGFWRWLLPVLFIMSHSVIYELVEWAAATVFGGDLGAAYLGTQGDIWDAQQDMLLATLGSVVAVTIVRLRGRAG